MNMRLVCCFVIIYLTKIQFALADDGDGVAIIYLSDDNQVNTWSPKTSESIIVEVDPGYKIQLNVTVCDMDGSSGDYAVIKAENIDDDGLLFSYLISSKRSYLYNTRRLSATYSSSSSSSTFTAIFTRVGEALTTVTTQIPTTTIILPTPSSNDSDTITVYLYGKGLNDLKANDIQNFKKAVAEMTGVYCSDENVPLNGTIRSENVQVKEIYQCPLSWKNFESCVYIIFAVPVNLLEGVDSPWNNGYQMNTKHLNIMWKRMAAEYMSTIGFSLYPVPNITYILTWRIVVLSIVVLVFIIFLMIVRYIGIRCAKIRRRRLSDAMSIVSSADRYSQLSLPEHYFQEAPPLFDNSFSYPYHSEKSPFSDASFSVFNGSQNDGKLKEATEEEPKLRIQEILFETDAENGEIESES